MDMEQVIMELIVNSGDARSSAIEAICSARKGDMDEAEQKLKEAEQTISKAHQMQTDLIQREINGEKTDITLLMVHAQDHLMNAMTVIDLSNELIEMMKGRK